MSSNGHFNVTVVLTRNDGAGTTFTFDDSDKHTTSGTGTMHDEDHGEEDFTDANTIRSNDVEQDTDTRGGVYYPSSVDTMSTHDRAVTVDPITGLTTTVTFDLSGGTDVVTGAETEDDTDVHSTSLTNTGSDDVNGTEGIDSVEFLSEHPVRTFSVVGTDAQGNTFNLQETDDETDNDTETDHTVDTQVANVANTDVSSVTRTRHDLTNVHITGTIASVDTNGNKSTTMLDLASAETIDGTDIDHETQVIPATGTTTASTNETNADQDSSTYTLHESTSVTHNGVPVGPTTTQDETGGDAKSLTNGVVADLGSSDVVTASDPAAQAAWEANQRILLLQVQVQRGFAVNRLKLAADAQRAYANQWTGSDWLSGGATSARLAADVQNARAAVAQLDIELAQTFGFAAETPRLEAGDEALKWNYATKFLAALIQFVAVIGGLALLKKGACTAKITPVAGALISAKEAADVLLTIPALKSELDAVTFKSEVANAARYTSGIASCCLVGSAKLGSRSLSVGQCPGKKRR